MHYTSFKKALRPLKELFLVSFVLTSVFIGVNALIAGDESAELSTGVSNFLADLAETILPEREPDVIPVQSLSLSIANPQIYIGTSNRITPTFVPSNATDKSLFWTSTDNTIVEITSGGIAIARDFGTARIHVQTSNEDVAAFMDLTVIDFPDVTDFEMATYVFDEPVTEIDVGTSAKLKLSQVIPAQAKTSVLTYRSSDPSIATINADGVINGIAAGIVQIFADFGPIEKSLTLTINEPLVPSILPLTLTLDGPSLGYVERTIQLLPNFGEQIPTDTQVTFKSNNTLVAGVSETGVVSGLNFSGLLPKTVVITAYANSNPSVITSREIIIEKVFPTAVSLRVNGTLTAGESLSIIPTFTPTDTSNRQLMWMSSNAEIATVSSAGDTGLLVGKFSGKVTITAISVMDDTIQSSITLEILPARLFPHAQWQDFLTFVRKGIGHFTLNMFNGFLGFLTFYTYVDEKKKYRDLFLSFAIGVPLSAFFESLQFFAPGRTPTWEDAFYNSSGYVTGQLVMLAFFTLLALWHRQAKKKQPRT